MFLLSWCIYVQHFSSKVDFFFFLSSFLSFRLEKVGKDLQLKVEEQGKEVAGKQAALEVEKSKLQQTTDELQSAQNEAHALQKEVESFLQRTRALEEAVAQLQTEVDQARTELREREGEERRLGLNVEQLETDLHSSKALTESLQAELNEKEKREMEMLGEKEQAVAEVVLYFHRQCRLDCNTVLLFLTKFLLLVC